MARCISWIWGGSTCALASRRRTGDRDAFYVLWQPSRRWPKHARFWHSRQFVAGGEQYRDQVNLSIALEQPDKKLALFGSADRYLRMIRDAFGVQIVSRDEELRISGEREQVGK